MVFILNRPADANSFIDRQKLTQDLIEKVQKNLKTLESTTGGLYMLFITFPDGGSRSTTLCSERLVPVQQDLVTKGVLNKMVAQNHYQPPVPAMSRNQKYTLILGDLVRDSTFNYSFLIIKDIDKTK